MIEEKILQALQTAIIAAVAGSTVPTMPIKPVGITGPSTDVQKWIEIIHLPNNPTDEFWGDSRTYIGAIRLILHWPVDSTGAYPAMRYLDELASKFTKDKIFRNGDVAVQITDIPDASAPIETGAELLFPVSLPYRCFRP